MGEVAGERRRERASRSVGGIRTLTVGLEYLRFPAMRGCETEEVGRFFQVATGNDHVGGSQIVQTSGCGVHLVQIGDLQAGQDSGLIQVWRNHLRQRNQPFEQKPGSGSVQ